MKAYRTTKDGPVYMPQDEDLKDEDGFEESYQVGISEELSLSLRVGGSYLLKEKKADNGLKIFTGLLKMGMRGLCISGTIPKKLRAKFGLSESDFESIWLSTAEGTEPSYNPNRIDFEIMDRISQFVKGGGKAIFLDGLELIELANGFDKAVEFVKTLSDFTAVHNSIFILSVNPTVFKREQVATLEWQLEPLTFPGAEDYIAEEELPSPEDYGKYTAELEARHRDLQAEQIRLNEDNKRLAEGIVSISRELENNSQILKLKEDENVELKKQIYELSSELRKLRLSGLGGASSTEGRTQQSRVYEERIKTLEEEKKRLEDIVSRRDSEIKHLGLILKEKDENLFKKQEMLKDLLAKVTDVEVKITAPIKKSVGEEGIESEEPHPKRKRQLPPPPNFYKQSVPSQEQSQAEPGTKSQLPYQQPPYQQYGQRNPYPYPQQYPRQQWVQPPPNPQQYPIYTGREPVCPTCGSMLMKVRGTGETERLFCQRCRRWIR